MTRLPLLAASAALSLALAACAGDRTGSEAASGDMTPSARDSYVGMAAAGDLFEIQSSQLARSRAQSPAIRDFAQMMIDHHTQTTAQLAAAARAAGVTPPPPALLPAQARMMGDLEAASAADFDRVYMGQQVQAHEAALALHGHYARNGDTAALRTVANATTPVIQLHLDRARQLAAAPS
jgi:putative membrane protein